ncbi:Ig-like domain-containing protein [Ruminococcus sp.]|uniref:Ig-like domain-containing protein n=1 Tax=Ruminococcus sp. TaxID=41978 RepID=UPI0025DDF4C3|nr:Ig-like domain-containing protein [Ruminococcus sp.]MBQ8967404.1 Ig-like domain-containing protein [Ruminococcus sp.]
MKKVLGALCALTMALTAAPGSMGTISAAAYSYPSPVSNLSDTYFPKNRLAVTKNGYMRVAYKNGKVYVENYDKQLNFVDGKTIDMELPVWGGFYAGFDAYYLAEGQYNTEQTQDTEVIRVIKYDKNWNRLGAASVTCGTGCEVRYPFDLGGAEMCEYRNTLYLSTGHEGFVDDSVGQGHQGLLFIGIEEDTMTPRVVDEDFWHSFVQFIEMDGSDLYMLQQSEGSRCTLLSRYDQGDLHSEVTSWGFSRGEENAVVLEYGGKHTSAWAIACKASVDGMAVGKDNVLGLGISIDQSTYGTENESPYNIYLTVTPKLDLSTEATKLIWLTDYTDDVSFGGQKLTKINDNCFMVSWTENEKYSSDTEEPTEEEKAALEEQQRQEFFDSVEKSGNYDVLSENKLHYIFIDNEGNKLTEEFVAGAAFSDCQPVVDGDKVLFCASSDNSVDIYTIDTKTGELTSKTFNSLSEDIRWTVDKDGVMTIEGKGQLGEVKDDDGWYYSSTRWGLAEKYVKKIFIDDEITAIGDNMLNGFDSLEEVWIGTGVRSIGDGCMQRYTNNIKVYIPETVEEIADDFGKSGWYTWDFEGNTIQLVYLTFCTPEGSAADKFAKEHHISVEYVEPEVFVKSPDDQPPQPPQQPDDDDDDFLDNYIVSKGDVDMNGDINVTDVTMTAAHVKNLRALEGESLARADVNSDGSVDVTDIMLVAAHVKSIRPIPQEKLPDTVDIAADEETTDDETSTSEEFDMYVGETTSLTYTITPDDAVDIVKWSSSDKNVAEVDENGAVTAVGEGTAVIILKAAGGITDTLTVNVHLPEPEGIILSNVPESLKIAARGRFSAEIIPEELEDSELTWYSDNEEVIRVNDLGEYEAMGLGTAVITVSSGEKASASMEITVVPEEARSVSLSNSIVNKYSGDSFELTATVFPDTAAGSLTWTSSAPDVATVENGVVECKSKGLAIITATAPSGVSASCRVNVDRTEPTYLGSNTNYYYIYTDDTEGVEIKYYLYPYDCDDQTVTFSIADESIARVEDGKLYPVSVGDTYLYGTTVSGINYRWYVHVLDREAQEDPT